MRAGGLGRELDNITAGLLLMMVSLWLYLGSSNLAFGRNSKRDNMEDG